MIIDEFSLEWKNINISDFITWKKNIPLLYKSNITHILESQSLTCQYLPLFEKNSSNLFKKQKLILGTNITNIKDHKNYLLVTSVKSPNFVNSSNSELINTNINKKIDENMDFFEIEKKIIHEGPVLKARFKPGASNIIATKAKNGKIYIYDILKHPNKPINGNNIPEIILEGHSEEGWGLDWQKNKSELISGADDGSVCIWDLEKSSLSEKENAENKNECLNYTRKFTFQQKPINEIKYHKFQENIFSYVSDHNLSFWDSREGFTEPFFNILAHTMEIFTLDFSYTDQFLLLTGGNDGLIKLWDMRNLTQPLYEFLDNNEHILKVEWCPSNPSIFASSSKDCKIKLWDLSELNETKINDDEDNEIFFVHSGHKGTVTDFSWNGSEDLEIISADSKNQLQSWKIKDDLYYRNF